MAATTLFGFMPRSCGSTRGQDAGAEYGQGTSKSLPDPSLLSANSARAHSCARSHSSRHAHCPHSLVQSLANAAGRRHPARSRDAQPGKLPSNRQNAEMSALFRPLRLQIPARTALYTASCDGTPPACLSSSNRLNRSSPPPGPHTATHYEHRGSLEHPRRSGRNRGIGPHPAYKPKSHLGWPRLSSGTHQIPWFQHLYRNPAAAGVAQRQKPRRFPNRRQRSRMRNARPKMPAGARSEKLSEYHHGIL